MQYEIWVPAVCGDIVPLTVVAGAKAKARATASGTTFHRPTYDGSYKRYGDDLLAQARAGSLKVCNQWGVPGDPDDIILEAQRLGTAVVVYLDKSASDVDQTQTHLCSLYVSISSLNEWGAARGDSFVIVSDGVEWIDERGVQGAMDAPSVQTASRKSLQQLAAEAALHFVRV